MDKLNKRVDNLEDRADRADRNRQEIESRLLLKLDALESVGQEQVGAIQALTAEIKSQAVRNELQDQDLERLKDLVHDWVGERMKSPKAVGALAGATTVIWGILELIFRHYSGG